MSRYIDADALLEKMKRTNRYFAVKFDIEEMPTADVVEVRHGTWHHGRQNGVAYAECSACRRKMDTSCYGYAYCSLCGARMDGERKD